MALVTALKGSYTEITPALYGVSKWQLRNLSKNRKSGPVLARPKAYADERATCLAGLAPQGSDSSEKTQLRLEIVLSLNLR
ncbi:uncharacterized protein SPSK_10138 [Sporothrix schenckii 1099-18]|uniref:Uncharacterized protein n=1 Tax=Sporothrix schenckii 1099-18 TaxID=1397361 RepID=A0A0F2M8Y2_SPOSC|nr:uncharacterized protein SPSK_10138 [Sporothrix schenckii 1099-18]KJR84621.1 hypothetical protein SPSK_10138 [Sporothrix schenckii 1099-18]